MNGAPQPRCRRPGRHRGHGEYRGNMDQDNHIDAMQGLPISLSGPPTAAEMNAANGKPPAPRNGAGIELSKLAMSPGRPRGARNLHAKHPSAISRAFKKAGLNWQTDFAEAIKANKRERIKLWLKLLPYLITQPNHSTRVKRWKGKPSKAALIALQALEGDGL